MSWVMPVVTGAFSLMETVAFIEFIEEEAIQSAALGAFLAIRQRNYAAAWKAINLMENDLIPHLDAVNRELSWACPYAIGPFRDFINASKTNLEIYKDLCTAGPK